MSVSDPSEPNGRLPDRRKLIAVVHADMVGYSRLIGLDDVGTLERLRILRRTLIDPAIVEHGGRIVNTGGDSLLIVFDSIDGAVRCAVKVQQQVPVRDGDQPPDRAIRFRVGINVGDVISDGADLHGDVVNVAARLQAECPPEGICVTRPVRDHVRDRLNLAFEELGELNLKNIARPVEAFVLKLNSTAPKSVERSLSHNSREALPLPDRPSIAVLAFANMSGDPDQEYLSDGFADDIITELSRNRSLFVVARTSSFTYKSRSVGVKEVARDLGVRYVVEGSVRRSSNRIRITAQLVDAETGTHIWTDRFDRDLADFFTVQDEVARSIVAAINPQISQVERQRATQKPPESVSAWEAYQRALSSWWKGCDFSSSRAFLHRAVALDPHFASAHAMLALLYLNEASLGTGLPIRESVRLAEAGAQSALELDPACAVAHAVLAWVLGFRGERGPALEEAEAAITLNPSDPYGHLIKGRILVFSGQSGEAWESLATVLRLDPCGPTAASATLHRVTGCYFERDYLTAEAMARRLIRAYPQFSRPYPWLAAALGQLGHADEARKALDAGIAASPSLIEFLTRSRPPYFYRPEEHEHLLDGLRKAGWQG